MPAARRRVHRRRVPRHLPRARSRRVRHHDHQQGCGGTGRVRRPDRLPALPGRSRDPACPRRAAAGHRPVRALARCQRREDRAQAEMAGRLRRRARLSHRRDAGHRGRGPEHPRTRPQAPLPVLRPVRVRLLPGPGRYARPDRRVPAPAPARRRIQLGRPDRRRLPVRPRLLLPPSPRPDHRLPLPAPAPPGQTVRSLRAHDPFQPDPARKRCPYPTRPPHAEPATLF